MDNRGVSAVFGYVLTLAIVTLLVSGLFLAAGNFVEDQHERAIRGELEVVGNRVAADIAAVDRLALAAGPTGEATLEVDLPARMAGKSYQIETNHISDGVYRLNVSTADPDVTVDVHVRAETELVATTVNGGDVTVTYNGTHLEVHDG